MLVTIKFTSLVWTIFKTMEHESNNKPKSNFSDYIIGDISVTGTTIAEIVGSNPNLIVFLNDKNGIQWNIRDKNDIHVYDINHKLSLLHNAISIELPDITRLRLKRVLAKAVYNAFCTKEKEKALAYFDSIEKLIKRAKTPEESKIYFICWSIFYSLIISVIIYLIFKLVYANDALLCSIAGSIGSAISIIIRNDKLNLNLLSKNIYLHLQVIIKVFLGAFSGILLYLASSSNLAFGIFKGNISILFTLSLMAGFSERFVPEIMNKLESNMDKNDPN